MSIRSQAEVEAQYLQRQARVQSGQLTPAQAFGNMQEWIIQLGQRKALLHPGTRQWMWFDRLHNEWVMTGFGVGEVILLSFGSIAGVKKLRQKDEVAGWCVYRQGQELFGPLWSGELIDKLKSQPELQQMLVWSPRATSWLTPVRTPAGEISFQDESGNPIAVTGKMVAGPAPVQAAATVPGELATKATPKPAPSGKDKSRRNLIIVIAVILIVIFCCLPALLGGIYFLAKSLGVLPAWLGGIGWLPLLMV